jgi:tetratricopeptide (TPR) repeat protein
LACRREVAGCGARLATVVGEILFNLGQFTLADQWYRVAIRAAQEAGDQRAADLALAGQTYLAMYPPDPKAVLAQVTTRLDASPAPTPAIAWLWGFRARALAMVGDQAGFQRAIERSRQTLDRSAADLIRPGICSLVPEKLAFYEARGWTELGNAKEAATAADRAIGLYDPLSRPPSPLWRGSSGPARWYKRGKLRKHADSRPPRCWIGAPSTD